MNASQVHRRIVSRLKSGWPPRSWMALLLCLNGCAVFAPDNGYHQGAIDTGKSYWLNYDAARRGGFILADQDGKRRMVLSEPAPDASASTALKLLAKASDGAQKLSGELNYDYSRAVAELAGRSQNVLVLREAMYRLSELYVNGAFGDSATSKDIVVQLYTGTMTSLVDFAKAARIEAATQQAKATSQLADAEGNKARQLELKRDSLLRDIENLEVLQGQVQVETLLGQLSPYSLHGQFSQLKHGKIDAEEARRILQPAVMRQEVEAVTKAAEALRTNETQFRELAKAALSGQ